MKLVKYIAVLAIIILCTQIILIPKVYAHPGNVYSDGSHHCYTNCGYYGYQYGELICHYPSYGCGDENIRQDSYEAYPTGNSDSALGTKNGASHAKEGAHDYIVNKATIQGAIDGYAYGIRQNIIGKHSDSATVCAEKVKFDNPASEQYAIAFQASYTAACIPIYDEAYSVKFESEFTKGAAAKEARDSIANPNKTIPKNKKSDIGWYVAGAAVILYPIYLAILNKGVVIKQWF